MSAATKVEGHEGFLVIGQNRWGFGKTLEHAKGAFKAEGGRLTLGYTWVNFAKANGHRFVSVDQLGRVHWVGGKGDPEHTDVKPRTRKAK